MWNRNIIVDIKHRYLSFHVIESLRKVFLRNQLERNTRNFVIITFPILVLYILYSIICCTCHLTLIFFHLVFLSFFLWSMHQLDLLYQTHFHLSICDQRMHCQDQPNKDVYVLLILPEKFTKIYKFFYRNRFSYSTCNAKNLLYYKLYIG